MVLYYTRNDVLQCRHVRCEVVRTVECGMVVQGCFMDFCAQVFVFPLDIAPSTLVIIFFSCASLAQRLLAVYVPYQECHAEYLLAGGSKVGKLTVLTGTFFFLPLGKVMPFGKENTVHEPPALDMQVVIFKLRTCSSALEALNTLYVYVQTCPNVKHVIVALKKLVNCKFLNTGKNCV